MRICAVIIGLDSSLDIEEEKRTGAIWMLLCGSQRRRLGDRAQEAAADSSSRHCGHLRRTRAPTLIIRGTCQKVIKRVPVVIIN